MSRREAGKKVLVLGNHRVLRGVIESCLAREFDILRHDDSREAFRSLATLSPDVIVMDIEHLNMMDGHSTAKWLRESHPGISAIFMMNFSDDTATHSALSSLVSGGSFTLECMRGALQGIHNAIRELTPSEPEYLMLGYRFNILTETTELAKTG